MGEWKISPYTHTYEWYEDEAGEPVPTLLDPASTAVLLMPIVELLYALLLEVKKANVQLASMTDEEIPDSDVEGD
jgi:hypothetical protein